MIAIRNFTRSSSFRVGVLFTLLSGAAMAFIIYLWGVTNKDVLIDEARNAARAQLWAYEKVYEAQGKAGLTALTRDNLQQELLSWVAITSPSGQFIGGNSLTLANLELSEPSNIYTVDIAMTADDKPASKKVILARREVLEGGITVTVARNIDELHNAQTLSRSLSWVFIAILGCISGLSFGVAMYVVNRINRMSATADSIMQTGNLTERLDIDSNWDDLSQLALVLNRMLDKIETSVQNIKSVTDNIAHDLRTPLSRLRSRLDEMPASELRQQAQAEADNLLGMFSGLLRIADIESKRQRQGFIEFDLGAVVRDVVDLYEPYIEDKHMQLQADIAVMPMRGDNNLIFQTVANLVDNAVKYAGDNAMIKVEAKPYGNRYVVSVNDSGPGIAAGHYDKLDRRFYRAQASRTTQGNGLGLSMVKAVVELHDAAIYYMADPLLTGSGLGVVITFDQPDDKP